MCFGWDGEDKTAGALLEDESLPKKVNHDLYKAIDLISTL
ncbi:MAG: hypothetical protein ACI81P_000842 [Neolewinella sp.]|jgi:hypothetical protein